ANVGYDAAERHFSAARMNPDVLMVEADHDLRNPADMIILDRIAKNMFRTRGVERVQSITRPLGSPIEHTSIPFQISMGAVPIQENLQFMTDRLADMVTMSDDLGATIDSMVRLRDLVGQMNTTTAHMTDHMAAIDETVNEIR